MPNINTSLHPFTLVGLTLLLVLGVHCADDNDPMLAAESGNYLTGMSYEPESRNYMDLLQARSNSASLVKAKPSSATSSSFFKKPSMTFDSSETGEIYKKAASEYWGNEMPNQGESLEDQSDYNGYGQQSQGYLTPQGGYQKGKEIAITPDHKPITLHYRTHSQPIMVHQTRIPGPKPEVKHTTSHEEPHRVVHEVIRPIIQEVHEIIQPYRRVVQQVQPVIEEVRTVIAKDAGKGAGGGGGGGGKVGGNYGMMHGESKQMFRKAALFEPQQQSAPFGSMALPSNSIGRSKVFINKRGIPVYQSNYMGPALSRS